MHFLNFKSRLFMITNKDQPTQEHVHNCLIYFGGQIKIKTFSLIIQLACKNSPAGILKDCIFMKVKRSAPKCATFEIHPLKFKFG